MDTALAPSPYHDALAGEGVDAVRAEPWLSVGSTARRQGWKLHLSSVPTQAVALLRTVAPVLRAAGVAWKCAATPTVLMLLNEGSFGVSQVGKFVTIYPGSDAEADALAERLGPLTKGFEGPEILTDLSLGGIVYARYGAFSPERSRDRMGQLHTFIRDADGAAVQDTYEIPFAMPPGQRHPFRRVPAPRPGPVGPRLLAGRYLATDVLQAHAKGSVFRAIDLGSPDDVRPVVVKEGRRHCCSDEYGRDMRQRLRRQAELRGALGAGLPVPAVVEYVEADGDGHLVLEYVPGRSLAQRHPDAWRDAGPQARAEMLGHLAGLAEALGTLHAAGFVHRDVTPTNVLVGTDDSIWLLDLELAHRVGSAEPVLRLGTPGFMSPRQLASTAPSVDDDAYGLGATMVRLLTGRHPDQVIGDRPQEVADRLLALAGGELPLDLAQACASLLADDGGRQLPGLASRLRGYGLTAPAAGGLGRTATAAGGLGRTATAARGTGPGRGVPDTDPELAAAALRVAADGLLTGVERDPHHGLWLSPSLDRPGRSELLVGASRGVAGVVYACARLARLGCASDRLVEAATAAAAWLAGPALEVCPPTTRGLHFGRDGVVVALAEAARAGMVEDAVVVDLAADLLREPIDWPDVTHGAAGQGLAALQLEGVVPSADLEARVAACAAALVAAQDDDGLWGPGPGSFLEPGDRFYGFAHGAAGIAYFLAGHAARTGDPGADAAWRRAATTLTDAAQTADGASDWAWSTHQARVWRWWCHGSPGVALAFLRFAEVSGEGRYADLARAALRSAASSEVAGGLGQCHGLSGVGEVYLEAARVLDERAWRRRAAGVARDLRALRLAGPDGGWTWQTETEGLRTADLMVGSGGILHFLARESRPDPGVGVPLLPA